MNFKMIGRFISQILAIEAAMMLPALAIGLAGGDEITASAFARSIALTAAAALALFLLCRKAKRGLYAKEGYACVGLCWIAMSLLGCLPFVFSGAIPHYIDALFEMVSGFTTTGASIVTDVEALPDGILYWRSFAHWVGGMGMLVFLLAVVPTGDKNGGFSMHLMRAESPGPDVGKLVPRIKKTAKILYLMYIVLSALNLVFLLAGGMPLLEALCTMFGTAGTGGLAIKTDSMGGYSPYLQTVTTVFMILFGINFGCFYLLLLRDWRAVLRDEELRLYLGLILGSVALITFDLRGYFTTFGETLRHAAFQVGSIITTTGYSSDNFELWPTLSKSILLFLMFVGACAGSTGGGLKCARLLILLRSMRINVRAVLHPQRIQAVRFNGRIAGDDLVKNVNAYFVAYVQIMVISTLLIAFDGFGMITNLSAVTACFSNVGPGFGLVGPMGNYAEFSLFSKLVLIVDMLAGRLEIFPILVLFSRSAWRHGA